jgi:hypothetical protein
MLRQRLAAAWQTQRLLILLAMAVVVFAVVYVLFPDHSSTSRRSATATPLPTVIPGIARLTDDLSADTAPAWSPDGTRIIYYSLRNRAQHTLRMMQAEWGYLHTRCEQ